MEEKANKKAQLTVKKLNWVNIVKGIVWDGLEYKLKLNTDGTIFVDSKEETRKMSKEIVVQIMDLYDKHNKCVSKYKDNRYKIKIQCGFSHFTCLHY